MKKYKKLPNHIGIRKVLSNGNYEASKKIKGRTFSKTFKSIKEAVFWRNTYNPFDSNFSSTEVKKKMSFKDLWEKYELSYFPEVEKSSQGIKKQKVGVFKKELDSLSIDDITPDYLDHLVAKEKKKAISNPQSKRCNFKGSLDEVRAVLNWYKENYDYKYYTPVLKRHYTQGIIRKPVVKDKVLSQAQLINFFKSFEDILYRDFAIIHFFCASRFGEIAGIQLKNIDIENKSLLIKEVVVEDQSKRFLELKPYPKNGHPRVVSINTEIFMEAILRRARYSISNCSYLFHINGKPMRYRQVQYQYNKALKKAGLYPQFSSTHILRYSMASESRRIMGTLDAAQATTGHKSIKMIQHYAMLPTELQGETVSKVGLGLEKGLNLASISL